MTAATSAQILNANKALAEVGTRSQITDFGVGSTDTSQEALYAGLFYAETRDKLLRAANWNFAERIYPPTRWKSLPGTPENPNLLATPAWLVQYPQTPYLYSYLYPSNCARLQRVIGSTQQSPLIPPLFSSGTPSNLNTFARLPSQSFKVSSDTNDPVGNPVVNDYGISGIAVVANQPGMNYVQGETFSVDLDLGGGVWSSLPTFMVNGITSLGSVWSVTTIQAGTWTYPSAPGTVFVPTSYTGRGSGLQLNLFSTRLTRAVRVVLTNAEFPLFIYTANDSDEDVWDPEFTEAFILALAGRLCQPLSGDKTLAQGKFAMANNLIIEARVADGNEGSTIMNHMPDWLRIRGIGGRLGYESIGDSFVFPYGPLFNV